MAGVVNYYAQVEGVLDSEGKIVKDKNIILQRGTFGDRQTKHSYPETVKACVGHMSRVASKVAFQNVATNSLLGKIFGKKKESILHASVKKAVNDNTNTKYQQNGLNTLSLVTSFFRRGKAVKNITTSFSKPEEMVSMFCMSSKDRTSMGIMAGITESFFNGKTKQDKQDFASSMIDSGHNQTLAARQGGTPGVAGLKLSDSLKSVMGLGAIGKLLKKSVNANKAIPKLNKFKVKKEGVIKKLKNFLGLGKNDRQELESIKLSIVSKKKNKGLEILKLNIKQNDIKSSRMK